MEVHSVFFKKHFKTFKKVFRNILEIPGKYLKKKLKDLVIYHFQEDIQNKIIYFII